MNVVGHQHVGVHDGAIALSVMLDSIKVASVAKNVTPVISPHDHMV